MFSNVYPTMFSKKTKNDDWTQQISSKKCSRHFLNKLLFPKVYVLQNFKKVAIDFWNQQISSKFFENFLMKNIRFTKGILSLLHTESAKKNLHLSVPWLMLAPQFFFKMLRQLEKYVVFAKVYLKQTVFFPAFSFLNSIVPLLMSRPKFSSKMLENVKEQSFCRKV